MSIRTTTVAEKISLSFSIGLRVSLLFVLTKMASMMQISILTRFRDVMCPRILADEAPIWVWLKQNFTQKR